MFKLSGQELLNIFKKKTSIKIKIEVFGEIGSPFSSSRILKT
jgi:hypothetical protein